jgi:hypothetical protein
MGLPVLNQQQLQAHSVGVGPGQSSSDVIWQPFYDSIAYPSAGGTSFSFYSLPLGQGVSSTPGAGAVGKLLTDTNLGVGNQLMKGNAFFMIASESDFYPGVNNANLPLSLQPGKLNGLTATSIGQFVNDVWSVGMGGVKTLTVGTDRKYIQDGPLKQFPPVTRMALQAALSGGSITTAGQEIAYAVWSGRPYSVVPIYIDTNQQFNMNVVFPAAIPTPSTTIGRLIDRMDGYLIRQAT